MRKKSYPLFVCWLVLIVVCTSRFAFCQEVTETRLIHARPIGISSAVASPDGSVICCGAIRRTITHALIMKVDSAGNLIWEYELTNDLWDCAFSTVTVRNDGTIIASGTQADFSNNRKPMICCFSSTGELLWSKRYQMSFQTQYLSHILTKNNEIVCTVAASARNVQGGQDMTGVVFKTDSLGNPLWCNHIYYPNINQSFVYTSAEATDSTIMVVAPLMVAAGPTLQYTSMTAMVRLEPDGSLTSQRIYWFDRGMFIYSLVPTADTGCIVGGSAGVITDGQHPMLMRLDRSGNITWANLYGFYNEQVMWQLSQCPSGDILGVAGSGNTPMRTIHIGLYGTDGTLRRVSQLGDHISYSESLVQLPDPRTPYMGVSIVDGGGGDSYMNIATFSDSLYGCMAAPIFGSTTPMVLADTTIAIAIEPDTCTIVSDVVTPTPGIAIRLQTCSRELSDVPIERTMSSMSIYPNPTDRQANIAITVPPSISSDIEVIVHDLMGREVYHIHTATSGEQIQIPTATLSSGVYTVELTDAKHFSNTWRGKIVVK